MRKRIANLPVTARITQATGTTRHAGIVGDQGPAPLAPTPTSATALIVVSHGL
jgi:hypothetical protein